MSKRTAKRGSPQPRLALRRPVAGRTKEPPSSLAIIGAAPMFRDLARSEQQALAFEAREMPFAADAAIFHRGDRSREVYLVACGRVRLSVVSPEGRVLAFNNAEPGAVFGEIAAFDGGPRAADATAMTDVLCYVLPGACVARAFTASPDNAQVAINFLCRRIRSTSARLEDIALHSIAVRIARFLLSSMRLSLTSTSGARMASIDLQMNQAELADLLGASRQKTNLALRHLTRENALSRRKTLYTCNVALLRKFARSE